MHSSTNSLALLNRQDQDSNTLNLRFDRNMLSSNVSPLTVNKPNTRLDIKQHIGPTDVASFQSTADEHSNNNNGQFLKPSGNGAANTSMVGDKNVMNTSAISVGKTNNSFVRQTTKHNTGNNNKLNVFENQYVSQEENNEKIRKIQQQQQQQQAAAAAALAAANPPIRGEREHSVVSTRQIGIPRQSPGNITFAEDDFYCYFVKGSIISEKGKSDDSQVKKQQLRDTPLKSILKDPKVKRSTATRLTMKSRERSIVVADQAGRGNTAGAPRIREIKIQSETSIPGFGSDLQSAQSKLLKSNTLNNSSANILQTINDEDDSPPSPRNIEEISRLLASQSTIRSRQKPFNSQSSESTSKFGVAQKRTSISNFRPQLLEKYEKSDYMKRSSDTKKLLQFQKQRESSIFNSISKLCHSLFTFILNFLQLNIIQRQHQPIGSSSFNATNQFFIHYLNANLIACVIFIYPVYALITQSDSLGIFILSGLLPITYSGHCFFVLAILSAAKLAKSIQNFTLSRIEKHSFKTVFSDFNWSAATSKKRNQNSILGMKWKRIDQILENIDDQDDDDLQQQIILMVLAEIVILSFNLIVLYFILSDSFLLQIALDLFGSSAPFAARLLVALATSLLLQINALFIKLFFHFLTPVAFAFYEKVQFSALFFNSVFILLLYEVKVIAYINDSYAVSLIDLSISDLQHVSYPNIALIITQSALFFLEVLISFIAQKLIKQSRKKSKSSKQNINYRQVTPITSNQMLVENLDQIQQQQISSNQHEKQEFLSPELKLAGNTTTTKLQQNSNTPIATNAASFTILPNFSAITPRRPQLPGSKVYPVETDKISNGSMEESTKESDAANKPTKSSSSFAYLRKSVFVCCFNFIIMNCAVLCPIMFAFGLLTSILFSLLCSMNKKHSFTQISFLDLKSFNSMQNIFALLLLALSFLFNFSIGFNAKLDFLQQEFSYLTSNSSVKSIVEILMLPSLLFPASVLLTVFLVQSTRKHQDAYDALNETYSAMRSKIFQDKLKSNSASS